VSLPRHAPALLVSATASGRGRTPVTAMPPAQAVDPDGGPGREAVYRRGRFNASFVHFHFPSNPGAAVRLFLP
jgi:cobyrinic acid a,c-diamide synthase